MKAVLEIGFTINSETLFFRQFITVALSAVPESIKKGMVSQR